MIEERKKGWREREEKMNRWKEERMNAWMNRKKDGRKEGMLDRRELGRSSEQKRGREEVSFSSKGLSCLTILEPGHWASGLACIICSFITLPLGSTQVTPTFEH